MGMTTAVCLFSGLGSALLPGLSFGTRTLEAYIDKLGIADADHFIWNEWRKVADKLVAQKPKKVVLIGHSQGVQACTEIARRLRLAGIKVNLIVAIDPTAGAFPAIGYNVDDALEFWASSGFPAIARRLTRHRSGALHFDGFHGVHRLYHIRAGHVPCASHPDVQRLTIAAVKAVVR
jgi:pimeloyl-ACP methyl ester carboxylesterase